MFLLLSGLDFVNLDGRSLISGPNVNKFLSNALQEIFCLLGTIPFARIFHHPIYFFSPSKTALNHNSDTLLSHEELAAIIERLKSKSSSGPDKISNRVAKMLPPSAVGLLLILHAETMEEFLYYFHQKG